MKFLIAFVLVTATCVSTGHALGEAYGLWGLLPTVVVGYAVGLLGARIAPWPGRRS